MLADVIEKCGLGLPPKDYNQNANEAINSFIKRVKGPGKLSLKETIQLLQKEVRGQEENAKLALLGKVKISLPNNIQNVGVGEGGTEILGPFFIQPK